MREAAARPHAADTSADPGEDAVLDTVGFLYPGYSAEDDVPRMERLLNEAGGEVRLPLVHTDIGTDAHEVNALLEMGAAHRLAPAARQLKDKGAQAVMWACTSASFVYGWEGADRQARELSAEAGLPASSTSFAFVHAVRAIGAGRVAIAATYPHDVAVLFADFLQAADLSVVGVRAADIITAAEVGTWGYEQVLRLARAGDEEEADAVLLPDTALHTAAWLPRLEAELGKPVLTAHQVTAWEGLRLLGRTVDCPSLGSLFSGRPPADA
jgi:maleate cis-trans isomerase